MNKKPNPQKVAKWQRWRREIEHEIISLLGSRQVYRKYGKIVSSNDSVRKDGATFHNWVVDNYVTYVAMSIRRQADKDNDSISLARLIADIRDNPECLTRDSHVSHYKNIPLGVGPEVGNKTFTKNAGSGEYIDPKIAQKDLDELRKASRKVNQLTTRKIAHQSKRKAPTITFNDVDKCIESIKHIAQKYILLLTAAHNELEPVMNDWESIFYKEWLNNETDY